MRLKNKTNQWVIQDWAGNICFLGKEFLSFDDAEEFLCQTLEDDYETDREEYYIVSSK